jgi:hypothetical protein
MAVGGLSLSAIVSTIELIDCLLHSDRKLSARGGLGSPDIDAARRRLVQMIHPDGGGSHYGLPRDQPKDVLLDLVTACAWYPGAKV